jgi:hypothetical protein
VPNRRKLRLEILRLIDGTIIKQSVGFFVLIGLAPPCDTPDRKSDRGVKGNVLSIRKNAME